MKKVLSSLFALSLLASTAYAEQITAGSLSVTPFGIGTLSMSGATFSFDGSVNRYDGFFRDWTLMESPTRTDTTLDGIFVGSSARGTASLSGQTYTSVGSINSNDSMLMRFYSSAFAPEITESMTPGYEAIVSAPFFFEGQFTYLKDTWEIGLLDLLGYGQATLSLRANFIGGTPVWDFNGMRYEFTPAHAPEPATMFLFASGLVATVLRVRSRVSR